MRLPWRRDPGSVRERASGSSRLSEVMAAVSGSQAYHIAQHRAWRRVAVAAVVGQTLTIGALAAWMESRDTVYIAVATDMSGRTLPIVSAAGVEGEEEIGMVLTWTVGSVTEAFTMGFHDYRGRIEGVRDRFTDEGFDSYQRVLEDSLVFQRIGELGQVVSAVARGAPVLERVRTFADGAVGYQVKFPMSLTFYARADERVVEDLVAEALVVRMARTERLSGLAIEQFRFSRAEGLRR